jgi:3-oxoacyl-[acyl-carrier-protein] synthase III
MRLGPAGLGIRSAATWLPDSTQTAAAAIAANQLSPAEAADTGYAELPVSADLAPPQMAVRAARRALAAAGWDARSLGMIIHTWIYHQGHDFWSPPHFIAHQLGAGSARPLGIQQMCNGSGAALETAAAGLLADPSLPSVLVTSADRFCLPGFDRWRGDYGVWYGDGAAAALLHRGGPGDKLTLLSLATAAAPALEAMHRGQDSFSLAPRGHGTPVDIRRTKKAFLGSEAGGGFGAQVADRVRAVIRDSLALAGVPGDDPALRLALLPRLGRKALDGIYRPAVRAATRAAPADLGRRTGHLGAGDLLANCAALAAPGMLAPGELALVLSAGAGFTWTCAVLRRPEEAGERTARNRRDSHE